MQDKVSPLRLAITGAITSALLLGLCWLGAVVWPTGASHMFVALFTFAPITSWLALGQGLCSAILFGALAGALLGWSYNFSARFNIK